MPPPVPHFWLVRYHFTTTYLELNIIRNSFSKLGFGVVNYTADVNGLHIKVWHTKPAKMSFWFLMNSDLIKKNKLVISDYTHNTRKNKNGSIHEA